MIEKGFSGNLFERFEGLDYVWNKCSGCTVLDVGSHEGLIAYEFARYGAVLIHGLERDKDRVSFSQRLFRYLPVESEFFHADLVSTNIEKFLLKKYDIVLFLGIYHNLKHQMAQVDLDKLVRYLLEKTGKWFVVRTDLIHEIKSIINGEEFQLMSSSPGTDKVGPLCIYERAL